METEKRDKIEELNDKICELSMAKRNLEIEIIKVKNQIKDIENSEFDELKTSIKEKLRGHYAIILEGGSAFSLWYVKDVLEESRYGCKYVDIIGMNYFFRKFNENNFTGLDLLFSPNKVHGITKCDLNTSLVLSDDVAVQFIDSIKRTLSNNTDNGLILAYKVIYDYYKHETGKTIEEASKESLDNYLKENYGE